MRDSNTLQYHRARYYSPGLGIFPSLDPFEGTVARAMSLNGYSWVEGRVVDATDPSGRCPENPWWNDIPGQRCRYLAYRLCEHIGCNEAGLNALLGLELWELESLTLAEAVTYWSRPGNLIIDRAPIIPRLLLQNPQLALQAIGEFISCNGGVAAILGTVAAPGIPGGLQGGGGLGRGGIIGLLALAGFLTWRLIQESEQSQPRVRPQDRVEEQDRPITLDLGGGGNLFEVAAIVAFRPQNKVIVIDRESDTLEGLRNRINRSSPERLAARIESYMKIVIDPLALDFGRLEIILGNYSDPTILGERKAVEIIRLC